MGDLPERFYACFVQALDDAGLPADPEFRAAMKAYMRWAVDNLVAYSAVGTVVPAGLPLPSWGWNGSENSA
jgi:hemoglobin